MITNISITIQKMKTTDPKLGKYQHYKTKKFYEVIGIAHHSETLEDMVVYKALYDCQAFGIDSLWVRPKTMFMENVMDEGLSVPRFLYIRE
jgi:hypothetical protein